MFGLMTIKAHNLAIAKRDELLGSVADQLKAEEFSGVPLVSDKVRLALKRLAESRDTQFKNRQRYLTAEDRVTELRHEAETNAQTIAELGAEVDEWKASALRLQAEVDALKPDAEAMRRKRQRDVDQKAEKRRNAAKPVARFSKPIPEPKPAAKKGAR